MSAFSLGEKEAAAGPNGGTVETPKPFEPY